MQTELPHAEPTDPPEDRIPAPETAETVEADVPGFLRDALARRGYDSLTAVQRAVAGAADDGVDLQVSSQTGSGKTVALGILLAKRLAAVDLTAATSPQALVIAPTRELAAQVRLELEWLLADVPGAKVAVVTGGTSVSAEKRALRRGATLVVGTPGRLLDHVRSGALDCGAVREVVLDEADQMLDMGFREELEGVLDTTPAERGTHLVCATFPPAIQGLAARYQKDPRHVEGTRLGAANEDIEHVVHLVRPEDRYPALVNLLLVAAPRRTLVFVNTRADTAESSARLADDGFSVLPLSGELQQAQRTRTLAAFRDGTVKVLVATDVAARGLDIAEVETVLQAGTPNDAEVYVHRSGRTGRAGRKGRSVLLVPTTRERRVRSLLAQARVEANWCDVPNAARVRKKLAKRGRRLLLQAVDVTAEPGEAELEHAQLLLEGRDPVRVVAALLEKATPQAPREPMELVAPKPRADRAWKGTPDRGGADRAPQGRGWRASQREYERFTVNWGFKGGANPRRLMALICRRGDVTSRAVGAIRPGPYATTFEIDRAEAAEFLRKAGRPDARDPRLAIRPA